MLRMIAIVGVVVVIYYHAVHAQVVIHTFFKSPVYPQLSDGYDRIDRVPWQPVVPSHPQAAKLFDMFLE